MIRVVIADDQALVRGGFRMILEAQDEIAVVGEAEDGIVAVALARELAPDLVLMDVRMPRLDGLEATRRIVADGLSTRVLVLTTFDAEEIVYDALKAGAQVSSSRAHHPPASSRRYESSPPVKHCSPRRSPVG